MLVFFTKKLIENNYDFNINIKNRYGDTPLHYLCGNKLVNLEMLVFFYNFFMY